MIATLVSCRRSISNRAQVVVALGVTLGLFGLIGVPLTKYIAAAGVGMCGLVSLWYSLRASWRSSQLERAGWVCSSLGLIAMLTLVLTYAIREVWWTGSPPWVFFDATHALCMTFFALSLLFLSTNSVPRTFREFLDRFALGTACTMLLWCTPYGEVVFRHDLIAALVKGFQVSVFVVVLCVCLTSVRRSRGQIPVCLPAAGWLITFCILLGMALVASAGIRMHEGYLAVPMIVSLAASMVGAAHTGEVKFQVVKLPVLSWLTTLVICTSVVAISARSPQTVHHKMTVIGLIVAMSIAVSMRNALYSCEVRGLVGALRFRKNQLAREVQRDHMTGLKNREHFMERVSSSLADPERETVTIAVIDLDSFKEVNDTRGHAAGNDALIAVAERIERLSPSWAICARVGGDEFAILFAQECDPLPTIQQVTQSVREVEDSNGVILGLNASVGLATAAVGESVAADELLKRADVAMYLAKHGDGSSCVLHSPSLNSPFLDDRVLRPQLAAAIRGETIETRFQPIYDLRTGSLKGFEALSRWIHEGSYVSPPRFIGLAERSGLIDDLTYLVVHRACQQIAIWKKTHPGVRVVISVNVTGPSLTNPRFLDRIIDIAAEYSVQPRFLTLELTESLPIRDVASVVSVLTSAREAGMGVALDDFGTGCNSIAHLLQLPQSAVKIDPTMIRGIELDPVRAATVAGMVGLAKHQELSVVAEGIENHEQLAILRELGVDSVQGFLIGRPEGADYWTEMLNEMRCVHLEDVTSLSQGSPVAGAHTPPTH